MENRNNTRKRRTVSESEKDLYDNVTCKKVKFLRNNSDLDQEQTVNTETTDITRHDDAIAAALNFTSFEVEEEITADSVLISSTSLTNDAEKDVSVGEKPKFQTLKPNIPKHLTRKGKSKGNVSKGKRPMLNVCSVDGDLLDISEANFSARKRIYELTEESHRLDNVDRLRNTIKERVTALADINAYTLTQIHKAFVDDSIPISLKLPVRLSVSALSSLLVVEEQSGFLQSIKNSINLQDTLRRTLLEEKKIPVCRCGYIYVHPSLTFAKMLNDPNMVIGQLGGMLVFEKRTEVMEKLDKLRYFLEILYEYFSK